MSYTNSPLVQYTAITTKSNSRLNSRGKSLNPDGKIHKITIHHCAGRLSVETIGKIFAPDRARQASSNYGIGTDGRIGMYVPESHRAWTSSSQWNDYQAVTIEVSNSTMGPEWEVSDLCIKRLIELCIDICKRNEIPELTWTGDKNGTLTCHDLYSDTTCPGPYLKSKFPYICSQVNKALKGEVAEEVEKKDEDLVITKGLELDLNGVNLYASSTATRHSGAARSGKFWVWGPEIFSGRVRICNEKKDVGVKGQVYGYINVSDALACAVKNDEPAQSPTAPQVQEPKPSTPAKLTAEQLAEEIKLGKWGNGDERKKRLSEAGYTAEEISKAQEIVNGSVPSAPTAPDKLSAEELAKKIMNGDFGNGAARKENLRKAGYTEAEISAAQTIVNASYGKSTTSSSLSKGNRCKMTASASRWATGQLIPAWVKTKTLYVRSEPKDGKCQVSTLQSGAITGVAYVKDLKKI